MPKTPVNTDTSKARIPFSEKNEHVKPPENNATAKIPEESETTKRARLDDEEENENSWESGTPKKGNRNEFNKRTVDDLFGDIADIELEELLSK